MLQNGVYCASKKNCRLFNLLKLEETSTDIHNFWHNLYSVYPSSFLFHVTSFESWGTGIRGLMRGMATFPQGSQKLLVVRDKVGRPPGELGLSKSMECDIFPSVLSYCWLSDRKGIRPVKKTEKTGCWW